MTDFLTQVGVEPVAQVSSLSVSNLRVKYTQILHHFFTLHTPPHVDRTVTSPVLTCRPVGGVLAVVGERVVQMVP